MSCTPSRVFLFFYFPSTKTFFTASSYLQPDNVNGYGYLEAVKKVFVDGK